MAFYIKVIVPAVLLFLLDVIDAKDPIVAVKQGQIVGKQLQFTAGDTKYTVDAFLGIPYAEAPIGDLRFKPPVPKKWQGNLNAQQYGKACPQLQFLIWEYSDIGMSEDCLVLNVFVPQSKPSNAAVMVFIHGGAYTVGAGSFKEIYDFHPVAALGDVIMVTINYRLNALGFLSTGDANLPGNNGMLDQIEALKWVQKNIAAFGGDPNRVTIFGESAGAGSVSLHTLSPLSKGLFSQAIMQSGVATSPWAANVDTGSYAKRAFSYGKLVGCEQDDTKLLVECLSEVSADDFVQATLKWQTEYLDEAGFMPFAPVIDGNFLPESPATLIAKGKFNPANVIVGYTAEEGIIIPVMFHPSATEEKPRISASEFEMYQDMHKIFPGKPLYREALELTYFDNAMRSSPDPDYFDALVNMATDNMFACSSVAYLRDAFEAKIGRVFAYYYTHGLSKSVFSTPWPGSVSSHGDDLMFFGMHFLPNDYGGTEEEVDMTRNIIRYWTNFAKTGNPNIASDVALSTENKEPEWPEYTTDMRLYKELAPAMANIVEPLGRRCQVWNDFLPKLDAALAEAGECREEQSCKSHWAKENQEEHSKGENTP